MILLFRVFQNGILPVIKIQHAGYEDVSQGRGADSHTGRTNLVIKHRVRKTSRNYPPSANKLSPKISSAIPTDNTESVLPTGAADFSTFVLAMSMLATNSAAVKIKITVGQAGGSILM